jgi:hypothetical protein
VIFVENGRTGRRQILDAEPDPKGNIVIFDEKCYVDTKDMFDPLPDDAPRHFDHHVTCPQAEIWSQRAKDKAAAKKKAKGK